MTWLRASCDQFVLMFFAVIVVGVVCWSCDCGWWWWMLLDWPSGEWQPLAEAELMMSVFPCCHVGLSISILGLAECWRRLASRTASTPFPPRIITTTSFHTRTITRGSNIVLHTREPTKGKEKISVTPYILQLIDSLTHTDWLIDCDAERRSHHAGLYCSDIRTDDTFSFLRFS